MRQDISSTRFSQSARFDSHCHLSVVSGATQSTGSCLCGFRKDQPKRGKLPQLRHVMIQETDAWKKIVDGRIVFSIRGLNDLLERRKGSCCQEARERNKMKSETPWMEPLLE